MTTKKMTPQMIDIASQFTRYPAGRYRTDGVFSGQRFREELLVPALLEGGSVTINLDGVMGYGSSFLEEVFGGLRRDARFSHANLGEVIDLSSRDGSLISEIKEYLAPLHH